MEYGYRLCSYCRRKFWKKSANHRFCSPRCRRENAPLEVTELYASPRAEEILAACQRGENIMLLSVAYGVSPQRIHALVRRDLKIKAAREARAAAEVRVPTEPAR